MRTYILICVAGVVMLCGCGAQTRYKVLSFFFEGVEDPSQSSRTQSNAGADAKTSAEGPAKQESKHGPFVAKLCSACHDPNTNVLLLPKDQLCLRCHELQTGRKQHGPVAAGSCLACHDPHRSSSAYLLVAPAQEFCAYCHDLKEVYSHAVHKDKNTSCTVCHNPHGSDNDYLLRKNFKSS